MCRHAVREVHTQMKACPDTSMRWDSAGLAEFEGLYCAEMVHHIWQPRHRHQRYAPNAGFAQHMLSLKVSDKPITFTSSLEP